MKNLEGTYRKYLHVQYRFKPELPEKERRDIAFKQFMRQIAFYCHGNGYDPALFKKARQIRDEIYPNLIFDIGWGT